jgi:hypothetical protein
LWQLAAVEMVLIILFVVVVIFTKPVLVAAEGDLLIKTIILLRRAIHMR